MQHWLTMSASNLGRGIASGEIDPVALTQVFIEAIEAHELHDRIYARLTQDRAMAEAEAAALRARNGQRRSALDGVPISWKDLFDTAGVATESGSRLLEGRTPKRDARVLQNASAAGLVCLGKTHLSELAFSGLGYNPKTATPPCINDAAAVAGGSSSGAAASVAFGLAAAAIGSDTGGSVRIPAAWNDLVGLKTSHGRISLEGVVPLCLEFDTVGPLTRSVEDAGALFGLLRGETPPDLRKATLKGSRIAVLKTIVFDEIEEQPARAFEAAIAALEKAGAAISEIDVPDIQVAFDVAGPLVPGEAYGLWRETIQANPDAMFAPTRKRFEQGKAFSAPDYVEGWKRLRAARLALDAAIAPYDALLAPASPIMPPNLERLQNDEDYLKSANLLALRNTRIANLMGLCGLSLPTGEASCGLMLMGKRDCDEALLRTGAAAETALG